MEIDELLKKLEISPVKKASEKDVIERYDECIIVGEEYWKEQYEHTEKMMMFYNGDDENHQQWTDEAKISRNQEGENRPMPTINMLPMALKIVYGRLIQDPPDVTITPSAGSFGAGTFSSGDDNEMSYRDLIEGLVRKMFYDCNAQYHFKKAAKQLLVGGFAWLRLNNGHMSETSFDETLSLKCIDELLQVYIDPSCEDQNYADAEWAIVQKKMSQKEFEKTYGKEAISGGGTLFGGWWSDAPKNAEEVSVDEFFDRVKVPALLIEYETKMSDGSKKSRELFYNNEDIKEFISKLYEGGGRVVQYRHTKSHVVNWYRIGGGGILESSEWLGTRIPLYFIPGREFQKPDGKRIYRGMFSEAKDSQRLFNYFVAAMIEAMDGAIKPRISMSIEQFAVSKEIMEGMNEYQKKFLLWRDTGLGGGSTSGPPAIIGENYMPDAEITAMQQMRLFTMMLSGVTEADLGQQGNEVSGRAITARQNQGQVSAFEFLDNLRSGIVSATKGALEVFPVVFSGNDVLRIMDIQQKPGEVGVPSDWIAGKRLLNTESAVIRVRAGRTYNDIWDSFASQIEELIKQNNPAWMAILIEWLDVEGISLGKNLQRRLLPMMDQRSLTDEELEEMSKKPQPPPTEEQKVREKEAEAKMAQANATLEAARMKNSGEFPPEVKSKIEKIVVEAVEKIMGNEGASPRSAQARSGGK